jgi:Zonular occludens toxin (Zot)
MSIFYICGKPGGGKSYFAVHQICEELKSGKGRYIVTNVALNLPELAEWCHKNVKDEVNLAERIRILDDEETGEFWLYEPHHKFENRRTLKFGRRTMEVPDFTGRGMPGTLYVIDEVHNYFGARDWQATGSDCTYFLSQHRKMLCDVVLITQHPDQTDKALRRLAQEYMVIRNLSREPVFGFRIANFFRWTRMLNSPSSPNPAPFDSGFLKLKAEEYGKLYDTMAGVGIAGRVSPSNEQRGIHWHWLGVPLALIVAFFVWLYSHLGFVGQKLHNGFVGLFFHATASAMAHPLVRIPPLRGGPPAAVLPSPPPVSRDSGRLSAWHSESIVADTNTIVDAVYCTGYVDLPNCTLVFLSDGRTADAKNGDIQFIRPERVRVFGRDYDVHTTAQIVRDNPSAFAVPFEPSPQVAVSPENVSPAATGSDGVIIMHSSGIPSSPLKLSNTAPAFQRPGTSPFSSH